jgi:diguanylate cyclase (GGDEF)-like protein/PAS domain S-box-containing protein
MRSPAGPLHVSRSPLVAISLLLFAAIFGVRLAVADPSEPIMSLMVVPISILAVEFGLRGGIAGAALGSFLVILWDLIDHPVLTPFGYIGRFFVFAVSGLIVGWLTSSRQRLAAESSRWFEQSADLNCIADFDGRFIRVNRSFETTLGYAVRELVDRPYASFVHPEDVEATNEFSAQLVDGREAFVGFENRYRAVDGSYRWLRWTAATDPERRLIFATARDVSDTKQLELRLESLANTDPLTELFNRRHFEEQVRRQLDFIVRYGSGGALFVFDIDNFKTINDSYGHAAGDLALKKFASCISARIRKTDISARVGGDEFAILFPGVGNNESKLLAGGLLSSIREASRSDDVKHLSLTSSLGIVAFTASQAPVLEALMASADHAMYQAKRAGGNRFVVAAETDHSSRPSVSQP